MRTAIVIRAMRLSKTSSDALHGNESVASNFFLLRKNQTK